jgi:quercetin 2,3-dioxygenase
MSNYLEAQMKYEIQLDNDRGKVDYGWLKSSHSFSFSSYHNPNKMGFGALRVLNDDFVEPDRGFATHGHENMEIISIPIEGELSHKDSLGSLETIREGEVQIMSAGTGIRHSELNHSKDKKVNFLQVWILPKKINIKPRYEQKFFSKQQKQNQLLEVVSPDNENSVWINQDARFYLGDFQAGQKLIGEVKNKENGFYLFLIKGKVSFGNEKISTRDAVSFWDLEKLELEILQDSEILLIEIPLKNFS